ncbi:chorismate synthase [Clostridiales bacterium PH28_bin88]|nr:chorismate synthase [Clostridiales bacterium PH28_bin88]
MLRFLTAGESHGPVLTTIIDGLPAGVPITEEYISRQLVRRQAGYGRGKRMQIENDRARITSGVRGGLTLGSPVTVEISNRDWRNWQEIMASGREAQVDQRKVTRPRPGHADLAGGIKYRHEDLRNILERASARETAARVAAGALSRALLEAVDINIVSHVIQIGKAKLDRIPSLEEIINNAQASELLCVDAEVEAKMVREIDLAKEAGDTLGGVIEILAWGVPVGLGSHVQWDRRVDGELAQAVMSIPAVKGVEIGMGFATAASHGSQAHDEIFYDPGKGYFRQTNRAGGTEGGITNGETVVIRAAMKPIPTLMQPLRSVDIKTKLPSVASVERSDVCAVPAAAVVAEAMVAFVLARSLLATLPADHLEVLREYVKRHRTSWKEIGNEN